VPKESKTASNSTNSDVKVKNDLSQQLSDLLKSKENGETNPNDLDEFVNILKNTLGADQGVLVDQSV
jgi:cobalamin biosynthesis protein CobT